MNSCAPASYNIVNILWFQKEAITTKLVNLRHLRESITKRQEHVEKVDAATVNDLAMDVNQFGMKIKAQNTDDVHILDEYNK